jgi:succinoglycan biosynthesis protein ExoO
MPSAVPFFSIVVPIYNKAPCLERSIKSVLAQTFTDFELVLVDDASTDESLKEVRKFSDPRIRLLHRDVPGPGGYAARNLGVAESRADWIAFLDADDEWYPEHLDVLRELALESRGGVVATGWLLNYGGDAVRSNTFSAFHAASTQKTLHFTEFLQEAANKRPPMWTGSVAVRRELLQNVGGFPERCRKGGDTAAWLWLVYTAGELIASTQTTAVYHRVDSFVTATIPPEVRENCVYNACKALLRETSDERTRRLLKRVSNVHVSYGLRTRAREGSLRFSDCDAHYFLVDWKEHLFFRLHSLMPRRILLGARLFGAATKQVILSAWPPRGSSSS